MLYGEGWADDDDAWITGRFWGRVGCGWVEIDEGFQGF